MTIKQQLKALPKRALIRIAGYRNMKALCADVPSMARSAKKGPSKKDIIKYIA